MRPPVNRRLRTLEDAVLKSESADGRRLKIRGSAHLLSQNAMDSGGGWRHERRSILYNNSTMPVSLCLTCTHSPAVRGQGLTSGGLNGITSTVDGQLGWSFEVVPLTAVLTSLLIPPTATAATTDGTFTL